MFDIKNVFYGFETSEIISIFFIYCILFLVLYCGIQNLKIKRNTKKLKTEGKGSFVETKIEKIKRIYHSGEDTTDKGYYTYILVSSDKDGNQFQSSEISGAIYDGMTHEEMIISYGGKNYDLTQKDKVIPELKNILTKYEAEQNQKGGLLKYFRLRSARNIINKYIKLANEGIITPYIIKNSKKISVGDFVAVYVDWEEYTKNNQDKSTEFYYDDFNTPTSYYFDLDFMHYGNKFKLNKGKIFILINLLLLIILGGLLLYSKYIQ